MDVSPVHARYSAHNVRGLVLTHLDTRNQRADKIVRTRPQGEQPNSTQPSLRRRAESGGPNQDPGLNPAQGRKGNLLP
jgi:hypothetical protein